MTSDTDPVVVEATYEATVADVWKAITDEDQMRQWFFAEMQEFRPETGFATKFTVHYDGSDYVHDWRITEVVPEKQIRCAWRYDGIPGASTVTWEPSETDAGTQLTLTHEIEEAFPEDDPAFSREACLGGWDWFLRQSLQSFLQETGS